MSLTETPDVWVNGSKIDADSIDTEIQYHPAQNRRQAMVMATETLIINKLMVQRAEELDLFDKADELTQEKEDALLDQLLDAEVQVPIASEQECKRYFEANPKRFTSAPLIEAKHILILAEPEDIEGRIEAKEAANKLITMLISDLDQFGSLAKQYSACPSKEVGGSLGQISNGQTVPEFERQLFAADIGLMETPIESRYGFHVVYVARKEEGKAIPYEQVEDRVKNFLNAKVKRKAVSQYLHRLVSQADINGFTFDTDNSPLIQ